VSDFRYSLRAFATSAGPAVNQIWKTLTTKAQWTLRGATKLQLGTLPREVCWPTLLNGGVVV